MNTLNLEIVTPDGLVVEEKCLSVIVPGIMGEMQVLPGHTPFLSEILSGLVTYEAVEGSGKVSIKVASGFVKIESDQVNILCEEASIA